MEAIKRIAIIIIVIEFGFWAYLIGISYWLEPAYGKSIPYPIVGNFILFLTFIAIICYTAEVFSSNTLKNKEINIKTRPRIDLYFREDKSNPQRTRIVGKFVLRNSSNVTAYNIKVEDINLGNFIYKFNFKQMNNILEYGGDEKKLEIYTEIKNGGGVIMHDENNFWQEVAKNINLVPFYFSYENIEKQKFYSLFVLYFKHNPIGNPVLAIEPTIEYMKSNKGTLSGEKIKRLLNKKGLYESKYLRHENEEKHHNVLKTLIRALALKKFNNPKK